MFLFIEVKMNTPTAAEKKSSIEFLSKTMPFYRHKLKFSDGYLIERPESEKPCQRVSNADRKVFVNPESF